MRAALLVAVLASASASTLAGQIAARPLEAAQGQRGVPPGDDRAGLEMQLRQKFARRVRVVLGLSPDQMLKLEDVNRRFGQQQKSLDQRENQTRQTLRQLLTEAPSADQEKRVGDLHDQIMQMQRQRLDLVASEQKELSGFMSNVQRVRFQALQENFRRQLQDGGRMGPPRGGPPPA